MWMLYLCFATAVGVTLDTTNNRSIQDIYIGALFPMTEHWWAKYAEILLPLFNHAFDDIFNRTDVLPGYKLHLTVKDTKGIPGLALKRYEEMITEKPTKIAVLGPCSSDEALLVGQLTHYYNMVQMMFVARTSRLADRKSFPSVYLTNYLEEIFNPPRVAMLKYFGWDKVATIFMEDGIFSANMANFHALLERNNMTLVTSGVITEETNVEKHIQRLKHYKARIIVGGFYGSHAPYIFCEAYKQGLYGKSVVWILPLDRSFSNWQLTAKKPLSCTHSELQTVSDGFFTLDNNNLADSNTNSVSGMTPTEFQVMVSRMAGGSMFISSALPYAYDSVWALALALNDTLTHLPMNSSLSDFNYTNNVIYDQIKLQLDKLNFQGISGPVSFANDGQRKGPTYLYQTVGFNRTMVATYTPDMDSLSWHVAPSSLWPGGVIPKDEFVYVTQYPRYDAALVAVLMSVNTICILMAIFFFIFNFTHRNTRFIKMSSPNINNIIILGSLVMYVTVYLNAVEFWDTPPHHTSGLCMARIWTASLGFTLSFGALFSKTWRVHILFRNTRLKKTVIRDKKLFLMVGLLLLVDLFILIPWHFTHPLQENHIQNEKEEELDGDTIIIWMFVVCYNNFQTYWISAVYVYKGLLLLFGTFLSWETRRVTVPGLNDSKQIGFCVYNVVVICAFAVPVNHLLSDSQSTLRFAITSAFTIFCTTLVLIIVFVPKILNRNEITSKVFLTASGERKTREGGTDMVEEDLTVRNRPKGNKIFPESVSQGKAKPDVYTVPVINGNAEAIDDIALSTDIIN